MNNFSKKAMARAINQRVNGREIIFRGEDSELEEILKSEFHLSVSFYVTSVRTKADNIRTFHISAVKNSADKYFLVMPTLTHNDNDVKLLKAIGFTEKTDFFYGKHKPIKLNTKMMKSYEDDYGNRISCGAGVSADIVFTGWGGCVEIGENNKVIKLVAEIRDGAKLKIGNNCKFLGNNRMLLWEQAAVTVEDNCRFTSVRFGVNIGSEIYIHENGTFGENLLVRPGIKSKVIIGRDCMVSWDNIILGADGHAIFDVVTGKRTNCQENTLVEIGEHVWLGARCSILPKVSVGNGSIIGASSVVTKAVPNNCIAVGSPAKVIRKNVAWHREYAEQNIENCPPEYVRLTEEDI